MTSPAFSPSPIDSSPISGSPIHTQPHDSYSGSAGSAWDVAGTPAFHAGPTAPPRAADSSGRHRTPTKQLEAAVSTLVSARLSLAQGSGSAGRGVRRRR